MTHIFSNSIETDPKEFKKDNKLADQTKLDVPNYLRLWGDHWPIPNRGQFMAEFIINFLKYNMYITQNPRQYQKIKFYFNH